MYSSGNITESLRKSEQPIWTTLSSLPSVSSRASTGNTVFWEIGHPPSFNLTMLPFHFGQCPKTQELPQNSWFTPSHPWLQNLVGASAFSWESPLSHSGTTLVCLQRSIELCSIKNTTFEYQDYNTYEKMDSEIATQRQAKQIDINKTEQITGLSPSTCSGMCYVSTLPVLRFQKKMLSSERINEMQSLDQPCIHVFCF